MLYNEKWDEIAQPCMDEVGKILLGTASYIEAHGWCQGSYEKNGAVCIVGAICRVVPDNSGYQLRADSVDRLETHLDSCATDYNDAPGRTKEEVLAALRKAAYSNG